MKHSFLVAHMRSFKCGFVRSFPRRCHECWFLRPIRLMRFENRSVAPYLFFFFHFHFIFLFHALFRPSFIEIRSGEKNSEQRSRLASFKSCHPLADFLTCIKLLLLQRISSHFISIWLLQWSRNNSDLVSSKYSLTAP